MDATRLANGANVSVGIRPEDMRLAEGPGPNTISGAIEHIEKLGEASLLYLNTPTPGHLLTVKVEGTTQHRTGQTVHVLCPADSLHVFDAEGDACHRTPELPA